MVNTTFDKTRLAGLVSNNTVELDPNTQIPMSIEYAILTNVSPSTATVNLKLKKAELLNLTYYVMPQNIQIASGDSIEFTDPRVMMPRDKMYLISDHSVDYYFNFIGHQWTARQG